MTGYLDPLSSQPIFIEHGDFRLEAYEFGPKSGELVILLHGFPECWATWRHQITPLATVGYRVLVPNLRGYGRGDKPEKLVDYRIDKLASDIDAAMAYAGRDKCHLVGHDWGGAIAWWYGIHSSDKLATLSILNAPHPMAFMQTLKQHPLQWLKSWYIFFFQLPWLPEKILSLFRFKRLRDTLTGSSNEGSYDQRDLEMLQDCWQQPGCTTAMLNYYRSMVRDRQKPHKPPVVDAPAQILWGEQDLALSLPMAYRSVEFLKQGQLNRYADATHWLNHDKPEVITKRLLTFFADHPID